jgi:hypothetical protein
MENIILHLAVAAVAAVAVPHKVGVIVTQVLVAVAVVSTVLIVLLVQ